MVRTSGRSRSEASRLNEAFWRYFSEQDSDDEPEEEPDEEPLSPEDDTDDQAPPEDDTTADDTEPPEDELGAEDDTDADMEPMSDTPTLPATPRDARQDPQQQLPLDAPKDQPTASQSIQARYTKGEQDYFLHKERKSFGAGRVPDFRYGPPSVSVVVR